MFATNVFHLGILVEDMDVGVERFGALLGIRFRPPAIAHVDDYVEGSRSSVLDLKVTYSMEGPPYVELLEEGRVGAEGARARGGAVHAGGPDHRRLLPAGGVAWRPPRARG